MSSIISIREALDDMPRMGLQPVKGRGINNQPATQVHKEIRGAFAASHVLQDTLSDDDHGHQVLDKFATPSHKDIVVAAEEEEI